MPNKFWNALKSLVASWCEERPPKCQTYIDEAERYEINTRDEERARARRLHGFVTAAEIHKAPPRAQRYNKRDVPGVSSSHGYRSQGCQFSRNEPSDSVESCATISTSSLREISFAGDARSRIEGLTGDTCV